MAYAEYQRLYPQRSAPWGELAEWERERFRRVIGAAAPSLLTDFSKRTAGMAEALNNAAAIIEDRDRQLAHERERGEALVVQAQDYASAESDRADRLVILAREILVSVTPGDPDDAPEFTRWRLILDQLDGAAGHMSPPDSDPLEEANQAGIKW